MKLVITVVHDRDKNRIIDALLNNGFKFTKIGSTGGFLREGNVTLLIGVEEADTERVIQVIGDSCKTREQFVNVLPPKQFLSSYVFFSDPTYATTNLVITRVKSATGTFSDVTVGCLGTVTGWTPVGTNGMYETTTVDLIRANLGVGQCSNGPQSTRKNSS